MSVQACNACGKPTPKNSGVFCRPCKRAAIVAGMGNGAALREATLRKILRQPETTSAHERMMDARSIETPQQEEVRQPAEPVNILEAAEKLAAAWGIHFGRA